MLIIMTIFKLMTLLSYYLQVWLAFKKSTKRTKSIFVAIQHLKSFGIDLFLNTLHLSILLNFIHPKIRIAHLDEHAHTYTLLCVCGLFADMDVKLFSQIDI